MEGKRLLFVTYHDDNLKESLSYAVELAKGMNASIEVLLVYKRKVMEKFDDMMTAVAFSEAGEYKTARELISDDYRNNRQDYEKKMKHLKDFCLRSGVRVDVSTASMDPVSAIKNILRQNQRIDMVILSPCITNNGRVTTKVLNKLAKTASRPVVTMEKQANVA
jgi:nucleotide-binding universal stress UspA family protein